MRNKHEESKQGERKMSRIPKREKSPRKPDKTTKKSRNRNGA
jgi:hypothetical protein